ncbi:hypothetical protein BKA70DRAFT_1087398, partial [Coprinopsis sp. MPI-PUGE-AT-0042]
RVPILGTYTLGQAHGSLDSGLKLEFNLPGNILSGYIRFLLEDGWLCAQVGAAVFGKTYGPLTVRLFKLPFMSVLPLLGFVDHF